MKELKHPSKPGGSMFRKMLYRVRVKISRLFEPEEVEVTFVEEDNTVKYSYRKIGHK